MREVVYFLSDAHLGSDTEQMEKLKEKRLLDLLNKIKKDGEYLYILGDLFEFWFEYENVMPKTHFQVLVKLKELTQEGVHIKYVPGNHDFWLGEFIQKEIGIKICKESVSAEHQGKRIFIIHGDGLAKKDTGYRILKKILRNRTNIRLYRLLPPDLGIPLAKKVASMSRSYTSKKEKFLQDYVDFARGKIDEGYDAVIMGHTHYPMLQELSKGIYLNVGDWIENFTYGKLKNGKFLLEKFLE
jgi:UDP-2,3-diacylglucosamine hydrolase